MSQKRATSVWLTDGQKQKLRQMADELGTSYNATLGMLVDNAQIVPITRHEAVATLPGKTDNRHSAQVSEASGATAVVSK